MHPGFWAGVWHKKLNEWKLSTEPVKISYRFVGDVFIFDETSLQESLLTSSERGICLLINTNTLEEFREIDKNELLLRITRPTWAAIGRGETDSLYATSVLLVYSDLKTHTFVYWHAAGTILPEPAKSFFSPVAAPKKLDHYLSVALESVIAKQPSLKTDFSVPFALQQHGQNWTLQTVKKALDDRVTKKYHIVLRDDSCSKDPTILGWKWKNCFAMACKYLHECCAYDVAPTSRVSFITWRLHEGNSVVFSIDFPSEVIRFETNHPRVVGWEHNLRGKFGPRQASLRFMLEPSDLAKQSVDLNLQLMKWRHLPDLPLEKLYDLKVLILGAGTLGCTVARCLVGWGVKTITFVDNGRVGFSNPSRQCLYEFKDACERKLKAQCAADSTMRIVPGLTCKAEVLSIPMPGHPILHDKEKDSEKNKDDLSDVAKLEQLIKEHDVIFSVLDSREARWLPTVLSAKYGRLIITGGLGFDSFLVMRTGGSSDEEHPKSKTSCYFCSDIAGVSNSQKDRTVDQQCTVTRPGLAFCCGALCVELMVALLQQQVDNARAAESAKDDEEAEVEDDDDDDDRSRACTPPSCIRGSLLSFTQTIHETRAFDRCIACSQRVLDCVTDNPDSTQSFVERVCADTMGTYLTQLTGIVELTAKLDLEMFEER